MVRWHASHTAIGLSDVEAIARVAGYDRRGVMLAGTKKRRRELAEAGIPIVETGFSRRLRIDAADPPRAALR